MEGTHKITCSLSLSLALSNVLISNLLDGGHSQSPGQAPGVARNVVQVDVGGAWSRLDGKDLFVAGGHETVVVEGRGDGNRRDLLPGGGGVLHVQLVADRCRGRRQSTCTQVDERTRTHTRQD